MTRSKTAKKSYSTRSEGTAKSKEIKIGPNYQAVIPNLEPPLDQKTQQYFPPPEPKDFKQFQMMRELFFKNDDSFENKLKNMNPCEPEKEITNFLIYGHRMGFETDNFTKQETAQLFSGLKEIDKDFYSIKELREAKGTAALVKQYYTSKHKLGDNEYDKFKEFHVKRKKTEEEYETELKNKKQPKLKQAFVNIEPISTVLRKSEQLERPKRREYAINTQKSENINFADKIVERNEPSPLSVHPAPSAVSIILPNEESLVCNYEGCGKEFDRKEWLNNHKMKFHPKEFLESEKNGIIDRQSELK